MGAAAGNPVGQMEWRDGATASFVVPDGVFKLCAVAVGPGQRGSANSAGATSGGAGGRGSDLRWINDLPVTPGETLTISIQFANGTGSGARILRGSNILLRADTGNSTPLGAGPFGGIVGGGNGGLGGFGPVETVTWCGGGGGAGGYSGSGGRGADAQSGGGGVGQGGAGAGGNSTRVTGGHGGGVGLGGEGASGATGSADGSPFSDRSFGGGGPGDTSGSPTGGIGGIRVIWGDNRAFPSTRTTDQFP